MTRRYALPFAAISLVLLGLHLATLTASDSAAEDDSARQLADEAMAKLKESDIPGMAAVVSRMGSGQETKAAEFQSVYSGMRNIIEVRCGNPLGEVEFIRKEAVGRSLVRYIYVEKFERSVMVWRISFYRSPQGWILRGLNWDDGADAFFTPAN
jgi:hypothetical protein